MTGPEEEQFDVAQRERKHYRDGLIAEDTAEVEDQAERISRALTSAPPAAPTDPTGTGA